MRLSRFGLATLGLVGAVLSAASGTVYPDAPPAAHTGGFGEPTCHRCHFDQPLNAPGGSVRLAGVPDAYAAGTRYVVTIELARAGMQRGGFEVAARFADGAHAGHQAGAFQPVDDRAQVVEGDSSGVQYAHHTKAGTVPTQPDTLRWSLAWTAPPAGHRRVVFHLAANAANDDASEFGDFVYVEERQAGGR